MCHLKVRETENSALRKYAPILIVTQAAFFVIDGKNFEFSPLSTVVLFQLVMAVHIGVSYSVNMGPFLYMHQYVYGTVFKDPSKRISSSFITKTSENEFKMNIKVCTVWKFTLN